MTKQEYLAMLEDLTDDYDELTDEELEHIQFCAQQELNSRRVLH